MNLLKKIAVGVSTVALPASMFFGTAAVTKAATAGGVYSTPDGTVWFVTKDMQKRPFTSAGAFLSYGFLNFSQVTAADASVTALPTGSFIAPADGKIFCATETKGTDVAGECALITGSKKASFTSAAVFAAQGHSFARAMYGDSSFLEKTSNISDGSAAHLPGVLVNNGGTVQMVVSGGLWGIPSQDVFNTWGYNFADVVPANSADTAKSQVGVIPARMAGELVPTGTTGGGTSGPSDCNIDGDAGDITLSLLSTYTNEDVGEGEEEVPVLAFEAEADDGSDLGVNSVKVELEQTNAADSDKLDDYVDEVLIMMGDEVVGSADADDFTESSDRYSKSISLDDCAVVDAGETAIFTVAITALGTLDSGDIDSDVWDVEIDSVRYEDGDGVVSTETPAADAIDQAFDFEDFAGASDVELKVSLSDADDINDAHVLDIDDVDNTDDLEVLSFDLEADGDSDILVKEIPVEITTAGMNIDDGVSQVSLLLDGDVIDSKSVSATDTDETFTFDDLDVTIDAGETATFVVTVDVNDLDATGGAEVANGDTIQAQITSTERDLIDAEDESGSDVATGDMTGTAVGDAHAIYDAGIMVDFVSADAERTFTADAAGEDDQGTFEIIFDVTAFDADMYIDVSCEEDNGADAAGQGTVFDVNSSAGVPTGGTSCLVDAAGTETGDHANSWHVPEGETRQFTFTVTLIADTTPTDGSHQVILESINWDTEAGGTDSTPDFFYNFNMDDFETPYLFLNGM